MNLSNDIKQVIALFGVPRSGTSWLGQILNSSPKVLFRFQPLFSYEFKDRLSSVSSSEQIQSFYQDIIDAKSEFVLQSKNVSGNSPPNFVKKDPDVLVWKEVRYLNIISNLTKESETKFVFIVRHPAAVIHSWLNAPKEFDKKWIPTNEWMYAARKNAGKPEEYFGYYKWKEAANIFLDTSEAYPDRTMIVKYEDLVLYAEKVTKKVFDFTGLEYGQQTQQFLRDSTSQTDTDPYGVYRKDQDPYSWRTDMDMGIIEELLHDFEASDIAVRLKYPKAILRLSDD